MIDQEFFRVPETAISVLERDIPDSVDIVRHDDVRYVREFIVKELGAENAAMYHFRLEELLIDKSNTIVATWHGPASYAVGVSAIAAGQKFGDMLVVSDLILNQNRQGSGARANKAIKSLSETTDTKRISLVCGEDDEPFFTSLLKVEPTTFPEEGKKVFLYEVSSDTFR